MAPWMGARWIVPGHVRFHPIGNQIRKAFVLSARPLRASLYVSCMGYYRATVNGQKVSNMTLGDFTNYGACPDTVRSCAPIW